MGFQELQGSQCEYKRVSEDREEFTEELGPDHGGIMHSKEVGSCKKWGVIAGL